MNEYVYFFRRADGLVKIGHTKRPDVRLKDLERFYGRLDVLRLEIGGMDRERALHERFDEDRKRNPVGGSSEWFHPSEEMSSYIRADGGVEFKRSRPKRRRFARLVIEAPENKAPREGLTEASTKCRVATSEALCRITYAEARAIRPGWG